ncbi:MAG TPA: hypothetical protein VGO87_04880, partial [Acidimicrobiia bacterium]
MSEGRTRHPGPEAPSGPIVLHPETGLPRFRRTASLRVQDGVITATDGKGRSRSFPLDGTTSAPARVRAFGMDQEGLMDGAGNLLAVWEHGIWGGAAIVDFSVAAGIKFGTQDDPALPPLRSDGIKIFDIPALSVASVCSAVGIVAFGASQLHVVRDAIAVPVMVVALIGALVGLILWRMASRLDPKVAERRRQIVQEALAEDDGDDE